MNFQPTVTLGELLAGMGMALSSLFMYALFVIRQDKQLALLAQKVDTLAETVSGVQKILENQLESKLVMAAHQQRLLMVEKLVDELRHGEGLVMRQFVPRQGEIG